MRVRLGEFKANFRVQRLPVGKRFGAGLVGRALGHGAVDKPLRTVADVAENLRVGVRRLAEMLQRFVRDHNQVGHSVKQRAVKIEDERVESGIALIHEVLLESKALQQKRQP